ncbi:MAG: hypothetical protein Q8P41_01870 [Pseudomonadota bacterium]|nr:hypothetical protein [Pseudomonadota bacterium]
MTAGAMLKAVITEKGLEQKSVAMGWLDRWRRAGGAEMSAESVPSRLSEALADKPKGLRFFFADPQCATYLFDEMDVPEAAREEIAEAARTALTERALPKVSARLVIDASTLSEGRDEADALFLALERTVFSEHRLAPVTLVLTEEQYRWLPRTYDERADLTVVRAPTVEEAARRAAAESDGGALLLSSRPLAPYRRWAAIELDYDTLAIEPADALLRFSVHGQLPEPAEPEHRLDALLREALPEPEVPEEGAVRRRLAFELTDEASAARLGLHPGYRLALAQALGVTATSLPRERAACAIAELTRLLPVEPTKATEEELSNALARARRRPFGPAVLRVGDVLHTINVPGAPPAGMYLVVHDIPARVPAITRILDVLATWTEEDYSRDPFLFGLLARLDPDGAEREAFLHARASLAAAAAAPAPRTLAGADVCAALLAVTRGDPPAARLRLHNTGARTGVVLTADEESAWAEVPVAFRVPLRFGELDLRREDGLVLRQVTPVEVQRLDRVPGVALLASPADVRDPDRWLDAVEATERDRNRWVADSTDPRRVLGSAAEYAPALLAVLGSLSPNEKLAAPRADDWRSADIQVALAWRALHLAATRGDATPLHDGRVLLRMAEGFFAAVRAARAGDTLDAVVASLRAPFRAYAVEPGVSEHRTGGLHGHASADLAGLPTGTAYSSGEVPTRVHLRGAGYDVEVEFVRSPFFLGDKMPAPPLEHAAAE